MSSFADTLIVIPCLNEEAYLAALIATTACDAPGALLVVADGGSTDRSRVIAAAAARDNPDIRLLDNPARLQSVGGNDAVRRYGAGRRWLVRLDAHCRYPPEYVAALVGRAERGDVAAVVVPMRAVGRTCFQRAAAAAQNSRLGTGGAAHRHLGPARFVDHGHHALVALDAFVAAGGYDETMSHNEDAELDRRLTIAGGRIWLEPACRIDYFPRRTLPSLFRQYRRHGAGRARTIRRHRMRPRLRQLLPLAVPVAVLLAALSPLAWWLALPATGWLGGSLAYGAWLGIRERSPCAALAGVAAAAMHLAWGLGFLAECCAGRKLSPRPGLAAS